MRKTGSTGNLMAPLLVLALVLALLLMAICLPPPPAAAQEPVELWHASYDSGGEDWALGVATDSEDNVIVTGASEGSSLNYYTIKYDPDGTELWNATYDGGGADAAYGVAVDSNDNIIVTGSSENATGNDTLDYYTIKYASNGTELWNATYDSGRWDEAFRVATDSEDNIIVTGVTGFNAFADYYTIKYDPNGTEMWNATYDGGGADAAYGVAVDSNDNIIVTGSSENATGTGTFDYYTIKYDPNGTEMWNSTYDGGGDEGALGAATDSEDNIIVTGTSESEGDGYYTIKYYPNGTELWSRSDDVGYDDWPYGVATDSEDNIIVTGYFNNTWTYNYYTIKYDPHGMTLWHATYDGGDEDYAYGVAVDSNDNIIVTGRSNDGSTDNYYTIKYGIAPAPPAEGGLSIYAIVGIAVGGAAAAAGIYFFAIRRWLKPGRV
jgi:uncharacterized delta-60 repeat protein